MSSYMFSKSQYKLVLKLYFNTLLLIDYKILIIIRFLFKIFYKGVEFNRKNSYTVYNKGNVPTWVQQARGQASYSQAEIACV